MNGDVQLKSIQIKNVRSLKDTGAVSLPRITVLVGQNSSGKSTFLRIFPLLKQSISKRTNGPILWAGDADDYVDFGSFTETITNDGSKEMEISFNFPFSYESYYSRSTSSSNCMFDVTYSLSISHKDGKDYVSNLCVHMNETLFEFGFELNPSLTESNHDNAKSNHDNASQISIGKSTIYLQQEKEDDARRGAPSIFEFLLPDISGEYEYLRKNFCENLDKISKLSKEQKKLYQDVVFTEVCNCAVLIGEYLCQGRSLPEIADEISPRNLSRKRLYHKSLYDRARDVLQHMWDMNNDERQYAYTIFKRCFFYSSFSQIEKYLASYFRQIHYIAPLRATAERYYRMRNLAIDEIDYQGKNLPAFLNSLSNQRLTDFQQWTQEHFGFKVVVKKDEGHLSVHVALGEDRDSINLADTGFGYSQILPIITQLWDLSTRKIVSRGPSDGDNRIPLVIAIEQPELHLHPALQAKLADAFIESIKLAEKNGYSLQLLLETHSQTIVNQFGLAIADKALDPADISVVLFEKSLGQSQTVVRTSYYDNNGYLQNWPIGFFAPGV